MSTPPPVGKTLSVKVDQGLYDDLVTLMSTGMTQSDAVRTVARIVAGTYRAVWAAGHTPPTVQPLIDAWFVAPYDAGQSPQERAKAQRVPRAYRARPTTPHTLGKTRPPQVRRSD
ncbi:hypothetical protein ABZZ79_03315 [Streptomyces sp. NPDC006458]|uniref:hypothetical protein n=1 Tax=Streptomyces sp. NPDC006458 TaxID=3154302 RepID=UPI0033A9995B